MQLKTVAIIGAILLILALSVGVGFKMIQTSESQKAELIDNKTFEPHFFIGGCASYRVMMAQREAKTKPAKKTPGKPTPKAEEKK